MLTFYYKCITILSKALGLWVFNFSAWIIAAGYFLLFPARVKNSVQFYRALYPHRSRFYHLKCAWKQFHNFTDVFIDRFLLQEFDDVSYNSRGWSHLEQALSGGSGAILLMSHVGNWEVAAYLLRRRKQDLKVLLYMGVKHKEQIERIQKQSLSQSGISIIAVDPDSGSPADLIEGIKFINAGGIVSLTGDVVWRKDQRVIAAEFLGHEVYLPEAPHLFALLSGAPLLIFFAFRSGDRTYDFSLSEPIYVQAANRADRTAAIRRSAQKYADILEETVRRHPLQWYHFQPFLGPKLK